jgi:hypothetical protein
LRRGEFPLEFLSGFNDAAVNCVDSFLERAAGHLPDPLSLSREKYWWHDPASKENSQRSSPEGVGPSMAQLT